jgi:hypothetical protein
MAPRPTDPPTDLVQLHIPLDDPEIGCECVWAAAVGPDRYRIANVPFFAHDVGIHDVVLALEAESCLELVEVLERRSVASFNYELLTGVDEPVFFADSRGTGAATERLGRSCFTTDLHHEPAADRFEQLLSPHARWYERFDGVGQLVREVGDVRI